MKEQWKKLDSDAKLLLNVEEGRSLPIKIELPISAFVSNKDDCCKRLLTILRIFSLVALLFFLSWVAIFVFPYGFNEPNVELEKVVINGESTYNNDDKLDFRNKIYQSASKDQLISNVDTPDLDYKTLHHDAVVAEEPTFISEPSTDVSSSEPDGNDKLEKSMKSLNEISKKWQNIFENMKKIEELKQELDEKSKVWPVEEQIDLQKEETSPHAYDILEKTVDKIINDMPLDENIEDSDESEQNLKISATSDEVVEDPQNKEEKTDDEIVKVLFHLINAIAFDEQMSAEDASFTKPISTNLNSEEKENIINYANLSDEDKLIVPSESNDNSESVEEKTINNEGNIGSAEQKFMDISNALKILESLEFVALVTKYLEPIVGENDEMLVWYYQNRNNPNFEEDNDSLKVYTAKLLYSTNIAEYPTDIEFVLNALFLKYDFIKDLKLLVEGKLRFPNPEDYTPVQYRIVDRITTKLNMNKLIKEDPKVIEVFSRMIETNNRLELSQSNINPEDLLFGDIAINPDKSLFVITPEEAERERLSVLQSIKKITNDDVPSIDDLKIDNDSSRDENENPEFQEKMKNVINAMKKIAVDDETPDHEYVEFTDETTPDMAAIEQENSSISEKSSEISQEAHEMFIYSTTEKQPEKSEESEDEVEKQLETLIESIRTEEENYEEHSNMNRFLPVYGDYYDY